MSDGIAARISRIKARGTISPETPVQRRRCIQCGMSGQQSFFICIDAKGAQWVHRLGNCLTLFALAEIRESGAPTKDPKYPEQSSTGWPHVGHLNKEPKKP